ncbi:MAG: glycosyltransferase [Butyrivibrio sp.]|nr:glycosyltransferase [Butyrivibrio sp.]MBQ8030385.1 glycosyltransferase [Butyrivibrio sp.]MBR1643226.1 glycosyltransferase [Butyrivibrio sp.]
MKKTFFTIIIVSYNAGDKLLKTVESVVRQTYTDYKILVKDGMSTDGSIEKLKKAYQVGSIDSDEDSRITLLESCDNGIYHAMNIAAAHLEGKVKAGENPSYVFFLNCGDYFKNENVLRDVHKLILDRNLKEGTTLPAIFYGDIYDRSAGARVASNPRIDDHACYRNVPSHQACFYDERLVYRNPFDLKYKVRADYEQFLRCYYREKAETVYMPVIIADYEGGGYSAKNLKLSETERREIIQMYLTSAQIRKYDILRVLTLSKLRTALSSNRLTAGLYNSVKELIYLLKRKS